MKPLVPTGVIVTAISVAASFLTVFVPTAGAVPSPGATAASSASPVWAFGGLGSRSLAGGAPSVYQYAGSLTVGYAVILDETAGPSGNYTLVVNRTMGVILSVEFCLPSCAHATATATVHYHAWEVVHAVLNLTSHGNVTVNGSNVSALALSSSSMSIAVGVRESTRVVDDGELVRGHNASVNLNVNASTVFTPALGLVPLTLTKGETWNSSSEYTLLGSGNYSVLVVSAVTGRIGVDVNVPIALEQSESVGLNGSYGGKTVRLSGASYDVLTMSISGPFSVREGFLFIPSASDLFGPTAPAWLTSNTSSSSTFSEESVDVSGALTGGSHLGFYGSDIVWSSGTADPASVAPTGGGVAPAATPEAGTSNATAVQGGPESLSQATTDQNCLATGLGCPAASAPRGLVGELVALGGIAAAVVIVVALVAERRRVPPSPYPNAALYPPGSTAPAAGTTPRRARPPPAPTEDDPLGHLW